MKFVGIDLAWGRGGTGVCVAVLDTVVESAWMRGDAELVDWLGPHVCGPCVAGIDAPLIVRNREGRRPCEDVLSRCFASAEAAPYPSNLSLPSFRERVRAEWLAARLALDVDPAFEPGAPVRRAIEVYPHPATVALFGLGRTLKYKRGRGRSLDQRRAALDELARHLRKLAAGHPRLDVAGSPRWSALREEIAATNSGAALDRLGDELDAYVCAYVALYYWTHGTARCRVVGDLAQGYVVTPVSPRHAAVIDRLVATP